MMLITKNLSPKSNDKIVEADVGYSEMPPFADWQAVLQGEMSPNNELASSEHYAGNLHKYSIIGPDIEDMTAIDPSR